MNEREKIQERLRKKEQELQGLEEKIRTGRIYVQALRDVLKLVATDDEVSDQPESVLRAGSAVAQAREVISDRREPVHINQLLKALGKEVTRESRASLTSSLAAYVRRGEIFTRPAPNTFGLVDLGHEAVAVDKPPSGFGKTAPAVPSPPPAPKPSRFLEGVDDDVSF